MIRDMLIEARFGRFPTGSPLYLAPSGTDASRYPGCARPGHTKLMRIRETLALDQRPAAVAGDLQRHAGDRIALATRS